MSSRLVLQQALAMEGGYWGRTYANDLCMSVSTLVPGSMGDDFIHNGNGRDAPSSELGWLNGNYTSPPHVAVWLR